MKHWQRALSNIRFLGPDIPSFDQDVKFVWNYVKQLEEAIGRAGDELDPLYAGANSFGAHLQTAKNILREAKGE